MKKYLCLLLALYLLTGVALAEETEQEIGADAVEASVDEVEFSLGGDEPAAEEPAEEEYADEDYIYESSKKSDYYLNCPDVYDYKNAVSASTRVFPEALIWPLKGRAPLTRFASHVGWRDAARIHRQQGGTWASWLHHGTDIGGTSTNQVVAAASGVAYAGERRGNGRYVVIDHGNGWYTEYQHLSRFAGEIFDGCREIPVEAGDPIGYVGNTGGDYPVHLHFEIAWSPDGPGSDDKAYFKQTHNLHLYGYSFPQQCVVRMRWPRTWEMCSAEYQSFITAPEPKATEEPSDEPTDEPEE